MFYQPQLNFPPDDVIVYLRKSRSDDPTLSVEEVLEKHETILDEWAEKNLGEKFPEENKFREVVSGETLKERPEINIVLRTIESPKYKAIAVVEPQRLSRGDLEDIGRLMKLLKHTNTLIITPTRTYDLHDEYDWDMLERELKRGNDYLEYTKKILNRGRLLSVSQGNYIGSVPPYGYDKVWVMDGKQKCPTLKENPEQADVVRMIFDLYVNKNMGRHVICHHLDSMGIKPPRGKYWSAAAMRDMLENVHYIGKVRWNWRKTVTKVEDSEIIQTRPKMKLGEYLIYDGKHEGIISEELFQAAQEKHGRNSRAKPNTKIRNSFAGIIFCQCGHAMMYRSYPDGRCEDRLVCGDQPNCHTGSCAYSEIEKRVCEILQNCISDFEIAIKDSANDSAKLHDTLIKSLEKKLNDLQAKELLQWEAQADPDPAKRMPQEIFQQLNAKLIKEKEDVQAALQKAYSERPKPTVYAEKAATFRNALSALQAPEVDTKEKNKLLKQCIDRITYYRETPQRVKRKPGEKKGERLTVGGKWTTPPIELEVKLKV